MFWSRGSFLMWLSCLATNTLCVQMLGASNLPFLKVSIQAPSGMFLRVLGGGRGDWFFDWQHKVFDTGVVSADAKHAKAWEHLTCMPVVVTPPDI